MKKNIIYIGLAVIAGLLAGYLIFGNSFKDTMTGEHDHSQEMETGKMWTCSMHPQIMQSEPGNCPICGMDLIPAESGDGGLAAGQFKMTKNAMALADIRTSIVGAGISGENSLRLSGTIKENDKTVATQASYFEGRIEKMYVNFKGEEIRMGQQLATLYSPELVSAQQELITAASLKETQPELYQAVRNKLKLWKLSEKQIVKIESTGKVQENFPVYANVSGTISEIMVESGDFVKKGSPMFKIANLGTVWAVFDAYESQISLLKESQNIDIVTKSYPDTTLHSTISFIDPVLNSSTRTIEVRATLQNPKGQLKPGMFVTGSLSLSLSTKDEPLVIPESAVLWTGERSVVYVKADQNNPTFEMREVTIGDAVNGGYVVLDGLQSGDEIVTNGTFTVDAAAQLKGKKSMMNEEGNTIKGHEGHGGMGATLENKKSNGEPVMSDTFAPVLKAYMDLKDALVTSDTERAKQASDIALSKLKRINTSVIKSSVLNELPGLERSFVNISKAKSIAEQRQEFILLSKQIIAIVPSITNSDKPVYVLHCPMADQNKGADWLSWEREIRNPFYGKAMLTCGELKNTF